MEVVLSPKALEEVRYTTERRMMFCGTCGVGIGIMTKAEFDNRYSPLCPVCEEEIVPTPVKEERLLVSPEIREFLTPALFFDVLREVFAERRQT